MGKWCNKGCFWCNDWNEEEKQEMCDCDGDCRNCDECETITNKD